MTVTFTGHSTLTITPQLKKWLYETINDQIRKGATHFLLGGYGEFDNLSAYIVRHCREYYPEVSSTLVTAYQNKTFDNTIYSEIFYPPLEDVTKQNAIPRRNQWMVDEADVVIAYVLKNFGGAAKTLEYATKKQKEIICYHEET